MRRLQLLLSESCRTDRTRNDLVQTLEAMGCTVTGVGEASLSVRVSETVYAQLFKDEPAQIPSSLQPWLASVSEAPVHESYGAADAAGAIGTAGGVDATGTTTAPPGEAPAGTRAPTSAPTGKSGRRADDD